MGVPPYNKSQAEYALQNVGALDGPCPVCAKVEWVVSAIPWALPAMTEDHAVDIEGPVQAASVSCGHCGFLRLHDWTVLGRAEDPNG